MNIAPQYPRKLPLADKLLWEYKDCFADHPNTKLCFAFLHKDYDMDMHTHEFYEINIVVKGEGIHYSKLGPQIVKRGDVFIIPPHTLHGYYSLNHLDVYHALYQDSFFKRYSKDLELASSYQILFEINRNIKDRAPIKIACHNQKDFSELETAITRLKESLNLEESYQIQNTEYVKSYLLGMELVVKLCELYENKDNGDIHQDSKHKAVFDCVEYFHTNYSHKLDINELCKISAMSRTFLFREFKKATGFTPNEYLIDYRMKIANKLLQETDLSVNEIASRIGCYDSSHFEKLYKKHYGCLPRLRNRI